MWDLSWIRNRTRVSFLRRPPYCWATGEGFPGGSAGKKNPPAMRETWVQSLGEPPGKPSRFWSCFVSHKNKMTEPVNQNFFWNKPKLCKGFLKAHLKGGCTLHLLCLSNGCCLFWGQAGQWGGCERMAFWLGSQVSEERQISGTSERVSGPSWQTVILVGSSLKLVNLI